MLIKNGLVYDGNTGGLIGCPDFLRFADQIGEDYTDVMADHFTVLILSSITGDLVMPLTGFATRGTTACTLEDTVTQAIAELKAIGVHTVALCLDGASENRLLVSRLLDANKQLKVTDMQASTEEVAVGCHISGLPIVLLTDYYHDLKRFRNSVFGSRLRADVITAQGAQGPASTTESTEGKMLLWSFICFPCSFLFCFFFTIA